MVSSDPQVRRSSGAPPSAVACKHRPTLLVTLFAASACAILDPSGTAAQSGFGGRWVGHWTNDLGESGDDSLELSEAPDGSLRGTWTGVLEVLGRRTSTDCAELRAKTGTRRYGVTARVRRDTLTLAYDVDRLDSGGSYAGESVLARVTGGPVLGEAHGSAVSADPAARAESSPRALPPAASSTPSSAPSTVSAESDQVPTTLATVRAIACLVEAMRVRDLASWDMRAALRDGRTGGRLDFLLEDPIAVVRPGVWSCFFSGAILLLGQPQSSHPVIAFYNPLLDAVLLTRWEWDSSGPSLAEASAVVASDFGGHCPVPVPGHARWIDDGATEPLQRALLLRSRAFVQAFEREFPPKARLPRPLPPQSGVPEATHFVTRQAADVLQYVARIQRPGDELYRPDLTRLRDSLATGNALALASLRSPGADDAVARDLLDLPQPLRQGLVPVYALARGDTAVVMLAHTGAPRFCIVAVLAGRTGPTLRSLALLDLVAMRAEVLSGYE